MILESMRWTCKSESQRGQILQWELANSLSGIPPEPLPGIAVDQPDVPARILRWHQIVRDQVGEQYDSASSP